VSVALLLRPDSGDEKLIAISRRHPPDTLIKLILSPNLEYKELTAQQAEPAA